VNVLGLTRDQIDMSWAFANPKDVRNPVQFLDFTIDGVSLTAKFGGDLTALTVIESEFRIKNLQRLAGGDVPLPTLEPTFHQSRLDRLLRRRGIPIAFTESAFPDGRVGLLYCPCGDMDCGVLSTRIEFTPGTVTWHDVGWQVTYEPNDPDSQGYLREPESFTFDRTQYDSLLSYLLGADWSDRVPDPGRR